MQSGDLETDTQAENKAERSPENGLTIVKSRGNSTTAKQRRVLEKPGALDDQPVCEVTVSYADEPDEAAGIHLLMNASGQNFLGQNLH